MGTSASSSGPKGKVPLVPPWVPPVDLVAVDLPQGAPPTILPELAPISDILQQQVVMDIAPARRLAGARLGIGKFMRTGNEGKLKRGLGNYVRHGLGGSAMGTRRMASTIRTANALFGVLSGATSPHIGFVLDPKVFAGKPFKEVMDAIVEAIRPVDGSLDAEAGRQALGDATGALLEQFPDADITALTSGQIALLIETYVAYDICNKIELDLGKVILAKASTYALTRQRMDQIKDYIRARVAEIFEKRRSRGGDLQGRNIQPLVAVVIKEVFDVFEEYIK